MDSRCLRRSGTVSCSRRQLLGGLGGLALATAFPAVAQPVPAEFLSAMRRAVRGDREVARFYERRNYRPFWFDNGLFRPEVDQLLYLLDTAEADSLDPRSYRIEPLIEALHTAQSRSLRDIARAEFQLSRTFSSYVQAVRRSLDVGMIYTEPHLRPKVPDRTEVMGMAASARNLQLWLETSGWMNPLYARLRGALAAQATREEGGHPVHIPAGPILRPGSRDPRVGLLRARLGLAPGSGYDRNLIQAVRALQRAHELPADGLAGPLTLALLNAGSPQQRGLLRLNLERARALPAPLGHRHILVDAAAARLWMYEGGEAQGSMRVVVGKPSEPTPMMAAMMRYVTLNPYWNVPPDLVQGRIASAVLSEGPGIIRARRYEILSDWTQDARPLDPSKVDWRAVADGRQELRVRQLPGRDNAMGRMKFMFPNDLGVYLHDTPDRNLLREEARLFSSGCVRLEDAPRLATWLFGHVPRPDGNSPEQQVNLPEPVPVYLVYMTAAPEPGGVAIRPDVYERDPVQLASLFGRDGRRRD